jgi:hypothetical protein
MPFSALPAQIDEPFEKATLIERSPRSLSTNWLSTNDNLSNDLIFEMDNVSLTSYTSDEFYKTYSSYSENCSQKFKTTYTNRCDFESCNPSCKINLKSSSKKHDENANYYDIDHKFSSRLLMSDDYKHHSRDCLMEIWTYESTKEERVRSNNESENDESYSTLADDDRVRQINCYTESNVCCSLCNDSALDIGNLIWRPSCSYDSCDILAENPITQSYKCLLSGLSALCYHTHDPLSEAEEEAAACGVQVELNSLACLGMSYYGMGFFEIKKLLFENTFQYLYELKQFNAELKRLFKYDSYWCDEWSTTGSPSPTSCSRQAARFNTNDFLIDYEPTRGHSLSTQTKNNISSNKQSRWLIDEEYVKAERASSEAASDASGCGMQQPLSFLKRTILDEIVSRILSLNTSSLYTSYLSLVKDSVYCSDLGLEEECTNMATPASSSHTPLQIQECQEQPSLGFNSHQLVNMIRKQLSGSDSCVESKTDTHSQKKPLVNTTNRNWTVAPKQFLSNATGAYSKLLNVNNNNNNSSCPYSCQPQSWSSQLNDDTDCFNNNNNNSTKSFNYRDYSDSKKATSTWSKLDLRPIGTKPISMLSTSSNSSSKFYRGQMINKSQITINTINSSTSNGSSSSSKPMKSVESMLVKKLADKNKLIWTNDAKLVDSSNGSISPFISYDYSSLADEFSWSSFPPSVRQQTTNASYMKPAHFTTQSQSCEYKSKAIAIPNARQSNNSSQAVNSNSGKYSVAPMSILASSSSGSFKKYSNASATQYSHSYKSSYETSISLASSKTRESNNKSSEQTDWSAKTIYNRNQSPFNLNTSPGSFKSNRYIQSTSSANLFSSSYNVHNSGKIRISNR